MWALLVVTLVFFNFLQMLSFVLIRPFSGKAFRRFNCFLAYSWWGACWLGLERLQGLQVDITGDHLPDENAIVLMNHQNMTDIPALFPLALKQGKLGHLKWFVKDSLKYVPGVGWGMKFLDCLFVKREWHQDQGKIESVFSKFHQEDIPIWLVSFPEGTRLTKEKVARSQEYAKKNNLPALNNVLLPRTKGFTASVLGLRSHVKAVYDITIDYQGKPPDLNELIAGQVEKIRLDVKRFPIDELPKDESHLSQWLIDRYIVKDQMLGR